MPKVLIIGDDMTGVNASAVLLARQGLTCATFFDLDNYDAGKNQHLDTVVISTDSRSIDAATAYRRVDRAMKAVYDDRVKLVNKRMDSTLRGNIGAELKGILDNLPAGTLALVVPVFPASGRVCIGGYLMVHQVPLEKTIVAKDPKNPITTSKVVPLIAEQMQEQVGFIELSTVLQGEQAIAESITEQHSAGCRVIVVDATTDDHVKDIAKAAKATKLRLVAVDPGPFTGAMAMELIDTPPTGKGQKVLLTVGSVSDATRRQMEDIRLKYSHHIVNVDVLKLIDAGQRDQEISRVVQTLATAADQYEVLGVTTTCWECDVLDLNKLARERNTTEDAISQQIAQGLAAITRKMIQELGPVIGGLFTSGGDVTVAVCAELKAVSIEIKDEVLPLAVYGRIHQGVFHNRPIITKGGLIGDDTAISKCVDYLLIKLSNESYAKKL